MRLSLRALGVVTDGGELEIELLAPAAWAELVGKLIVPVAWDELEGKFLEHPSWGGLVGNGLDPPVEVPVVLPGGSSKSSSMVTT